MSVERVNTIREAAYKAAWELRGAEDRRHAIRAASDVWAEALAQVEAERDALRKALTTHGAAIAWARKVMPDRRHDLAPTDYFMARALVAIADAVPPAADSGTPPEESNDG